MSECGANKVYLSYVLCIYLFYAYIPIFIHFNAFSALWTLNVQYLVDSA